MASLARCTNELSGRGAANGCLDGHSCDTVTYKQKIIQTTAFKCRGQRRCFLFLHLFYLVTVIFPLSLSHQQVKKQYVWEKKTLVFPFASFVLQWNHGNNWMLAVRFFEIGLGMTHSRQNLKIKTWFFTPPLKPLCVTVKHFAANDQPKNS